MSAVLAIWTEWVTSMDFWLAVLVLTVTLAIFVGTIRSPSELILGRFRPPPREGDTDDDLNPH